MLVRHEEIITRHQERQENIRLVARFINLVNEEAALLEGVE